MNTTRILLLLILVMVSLVGCDQTRNTSEQVQEISEASLAPFKDVILQYDRNQAGFPPLPTRGTLKIETINRENWRQDYPPPRYDVMLHFIDDSPDFHYTYCTVAFKKRDGRLTWIGEQHSFHGPLKYIADESTVNESVTITYETEQIAMVGTNMVGPLYQYSGPHSRDLAATEIAPMLTGWGYLPPPNK